MIRGPCLSCPAVSHLVSAVSTTKQVVRRDCASRQCANCCQQVTERGKIETDVPFAVRVGVVTIIKIHYAEIRIRYERSASSILVYDVGFDGKRATLELNTWGNKQQGASKLVAYVGLSSTHVRVHGAGVLVVVLGRYAVQVTFVCCCG